MKINHTAKKIASFLAVIVIFYFLGRILTVNWNKVKEYEFSFDYTYLAISITVLLSNIFIRGLIWNRILRAFWHGETLTYFEAIIINTYSNFGKYIPGKFWSVAGAVYLGSQKGIAKNKLAISYTLQAVMGILVGFILGSVFIFVAIGGKYSYFNYPMIIVLLLSFLCFSRPDLLLRFINSVLKRIRKEPIPRNCFPTTKEFAFVLLYLVLNTIIGGYAFFLFVCSLIPLPFSYVIGFIGISSIAHVSGFIAIFAPGGIGVKEGVLVLLLQYYLPTGVAALIAILSRIWMIAVDILALLIAKAASVYHRYSVRTNFTA